MPLIDIPDDIAKTCLAVFRKEGRRKDRVAAIAMNLFLSGIEDGVISLGAARKFLSDDTKVSDFIKRIRQRINRERKEATNKEGHKKSDVHVVIGLLKRVIENTDPIVTRKSGFWTNIRAGAIYFLAGLVASPLFSIVFKKPLDSLDKWLNSETGPETGKKQQPPAPPSQDREILIENTGVKNGAIPSRLPADVIAPIGFRFRNPARPFSNNRARICPEAIRLISSPADVRVICTRPDVPVIRSRLAAGQRPR